MGSLPAEKMKSSYITGSASMIATCESCKTWLGSGGNGDGDGDGDGGGAVLDGSDDSDL